VDRRTYTFLVASAAFLFFYLSLRALVVPPQPPDQDDGNPAAEVVDEAEASDEPAPTEPPSEEVLAGDEREAAAEARVESTQGAAEWFTLGSMDPADNQNLLITFSNRGGAIERIELTARHEDGDLAYRRVDTRSGYLGYFAGRPSDRLDGMAVHVVGPGTPAAQAATEDGTVGIEVGDVITAVNRLPVRSEADLRVALLETKPGQSVSVEVVRGSSAQAEGTPLVFRATLSQHPLDLVRLARVGGTDQIAGNLSRLSCLMTLAQVGQKTIGSAERSLAALPDPELQLWTAEQRQGEDGSQTIVFETTLGSEAMSPLGAEPVQLRRSFTVHPDSFVVDMDVEVVNLGEQPQDLAYRLEGANGVTCEGWWYSNKISPNFSGAAARDIVYRTENLGYELVSGVTLLEEARDNPQDPSYGIFAVDRNEPAPQLEFMGIDTQYFAVAYMPPADQDALSTYQRAGAMIVADPDAVENNRERAVNVSYFLHSRAEELAPGGSMKASVQMFAGPKEPALLATYGLSDFIYYGWFSVFSRLLSGLLHFLQNIVGNYALAIVLLTVIVRGLMFPLSRNAAVNAQRMQELAPEMKKIAEKYKDDMEGRLKAQQALQKRVGFNPLAGCLPMFLQLPIFMGLYRALSVDIDLRQKPLWSPTGWASNLSAPDQFYYWGDWMPEFFAGRGTGWLGPYLNLLPIIVVALFITQQKLFMPPATDEQTQMTQKVMSIMTLFMGLFFFRVPAGLCIYFIASSLWGIGERILVKKTLPQGKHFNLDEDGDVIDAVSSKQSAGGKSGDKLTLAERLIQQVNQKETEPPVERPSKRRRPPTKKKKNR
jgi:YidC/Oxa1 family membrane protein insertase